MSIGDVAVCRILAGR